MTDQINIQVGDCVRAMRVVGDGWTVSCTGEVVEYHSESPVPDTEGPILIVDSAEDGPVPVRVSQVEEILERAEPEFGPDLVREKDWFAFDEHVEPNDGVDDHCWWWADSYISNTQIEQVIDDPDVDLGIIEEHDEHGFRIALYPAAGGPPEYATCNSCDTQLSDLELDTGVCACGAIVEVDHPDG